MTDAMNKGDAAALTAVAAVSAAPATAARGAGTLMILALAATATMLCASGAWPAGLAVATATALAGAVIRGQASALMRAERRYVGMVAHCPDGILVIDGAGRIERVNQALLALSGYSASELLGAGVECLVPSRYVAHATHVERYLAQPEVRYMGNGRELLLRHRDGHEIDVEISLAPVGDGAEACVVVTIRDIAARKQAAHALAASERRLRGITNAVPGALYQFERRASGELRFTFVSDGIRKLLDLDDTDEGMSLESFGREVLAEDLPGLLASIEAAADSDGPWVHEFRVRTHGGALRWVRGTSLPCPVDEHGNREWNGILMDVSETRALSAQLEHQASHDPLTGLPNRRALEQRLLDALAHLPPDHELVVAFLDLDQFKVVNDTCGHDAGDELLRQVAALLKSRLRKPDVLARLGGDEFAVIMECDLQLAEGILQRVREAIAELRFVWQDKTFNPTASVGVVISGMPTTVADLLRRADAACHAAKDAGRNCVRVFHDDDAQISKQNGQMRWVPLIVEAVQSDRLELYAQPIVALGVDADTTPHFEVLLRMRLSAGELAPPGAFLPAAERYNLAPRLDRWVVETLFARIERWVAGGNPCPVFNVNLSGLSIGDSDTTAFIVQQFRRRAVPPSAICFEITETSAIARLSRAQAFIAELKTLGCRFALDDFGSGISSFGQLKNLDIDFVKIDGLFVRDIARDRVDRVMVTAINDMAHALDIATVAEFVEDQDVLSIVKSIGIDYAQGYGLGRPQPLEEQLNSLASAWSEAATVSVPGRAALG